MSNPPPPKRPDRFAYKDRAAWRRALAAWRKEMKRYFKRYPQITDEEV